MLKTTQNMFFFKKKKNTNSTHSNKHIFSIGLKVKTTANDLYPFRFEALVQSGTGTMSQLQNL